MYHSTQHIDSYISKALIAVLAVSLIAIVSASSFTDGMTTGYIVSNVERNFPTEKRQTIKYNNFTRDTELQKFPPVKHPQCFMEKIKIVKPPPTLVEMLIGIILIAALMMVPIHLLCFADDDTRCWFIGYMIGRNLETTNCISNGFEHHNAYFPFTSTVVHPNL